MSLRAIDLAHGARVLAAVIVGGAAPSVLAQRAGLVGGSVVDEDGNPLAGVLVRAENPHRRHPAGVRNHGRRRR